MAENILAATTRKMRTKEDTELKNNWEQENKHEVYREQNTSYCKNLWRSTLSGKKGMCKLNFIFHFVLFLSSRLGMWNPIDYKLQSIQPAWQAQNVALILFFLLL